MNHQPFENWLFAEEPLPEEDARALQAHLASCEHCAELEASWLDVTNLFATVPTVAPSPGFVNRWQATLETDRMLARETRQRWQSWIMLIAIANGALIMLVLLGVQVFRTYTSLTDLLLAWVYRLAVIFTLAHGLQNVFGTLLRTIPGLIPASWWGMASLLFGFSTLVWIVSMKKLTSLPRRNS